ncbi:hypothetical protein BDR03DRAFT_1010555 [Suillus americanus]|nr:hypothetical protein BDR03DRAFT_1010555 [Suillus americanus]
MSSFQLLIQQLELSSDAITTASISSLFCFITIGTTLKNDIILAEPSSTPINEPLNVLPPAIAKFLGAGCSISPAQVSDAWALLKDIIWTGGIKMDTGELWETEGMHRGFPDVLEAICNEILDPIKELAIVAARKAVIDVPRNVADDVHPLTIDVVIHEDSIVSLATEETQSVE